MVARVLEAESINYIALDINDDIVREEIANGLPVFNGFLPAPIKVGKQLPLFTP